MTRPPQLDALHPIDVARRYDPLVAELLIAYRAERNAREQIAAAVDQLLDITPQTRVRGLALIAELDELLHGQVAGAAVAA